MLLRVSGRMRDASSHGTFRQGAALACHRFARLGVENTKEPRQTAGLSEICYSRFIRLNARIKPENTIETVEHSLIRMFRDGPEDAP